MEPTTMEPDDRPSRRPRAARSPFIRGPKWRTRTTSGRRHTAALITFAIVLGTGLLVMVPSMWVLDRLGAPTWMVLAPWWLPTLGTIGWTLVRPRVAEVSDDDDDSWFGYSIRWALVGELATRPAPVRVLGALVFGAPVVWAVLVSGALTLTGIL